MSENSDTNEMASPEGAAGPSDPAAAQSVPGALSWWEPAPAAGDAPAGEEVDPAVAESVPGALSWWEPAPAAGDAPAGEETDPAAGGWGQQPPGGYPPGDQPYWGPPPAGGWWGGASSGPPPPAEPHRTRAPWYLRPLPVAALVVATVGAGIGFGHTLWPAGDATPTAASVPGSSSGVPSSTNPFSGSGTTNPFSGSGTTNPFSGSGTTNPFSGSGGSGSIGDGSGESGSGATGSASGGPSDVSSIAAKVDPALVDINVTFVGQQRGAGTGIVLTSNGEVLTNNHVVEGATSISVTDIGNGKTYGATVVGYDATDDVAVIQLSKASGLKTAAMADSSKVTVGQGVVAIGNAGGTGGTPTAAGGSITALNQAITASDQLSGASENLTGLLETDANIQPGDSGGSLVNTAGQVVGMDTAALQGFALSSQTNQGYAVPINKALSIASQIESGRSSSTVHVGPTAYLGVLVSSSGSSASPYSGGYRSPFAGQGQSPSTASGAIISGVVSGAPAAQAGLAPGDVITSLGGRSVTSVSDLTAALAHYKPGDSVQVGWTDSSGAAHHTTITLGSGPAQ